MKGNPRIIKIVPVIVIVLTLLMPVLVTALPTHLPVSTDNEYEDSATVWGRYIAWRVGVDKNADGDIDINEPSWIMLHDTTTGVSEAITPTESAGYRTASFYYHAEAPKLYGSKLTYLDLVGTAHNKYTLRMYNITTDETYEVPYANQLPALSGLLSTRHDFYGDWVAISSYQTTHRQLYLYNIEDNIARVLLPTTETDVSVITVYMNDDFASYTKLNTVTDIWSLGVYNFSSNKNAIIATPVTISEIIVGSVYKNYIGISYETSLNYNGALMNLNGIGWDTGSWTGNPPSQTFNWDNLQSNITIFDDDTTYHTLNVIIWGNYVFYNNATTNYDSNVMVYNINNDEISYVTNSIYRQVLTDVYDDKILWHTNENSLVYDYNAKANFDIYRTQTDLETLGQDVINMAPLIIITLFFAFALGAFLLFGRNGGGNY